jgi:hypothetical protein
VICRFRAAAALVFLCAAVSPAAAQSRIELGAGVSWISGFGAGGIDAQLTRNPATGSTPLTLFATDSRVRPAAAIAVRAGLYLTRRLEIEAIGEYARPVLRTTISSDFEGATGTTAESRLTSVIAGGSLLYHFGAARLTPFAFGGAGWMRQLDEDNVMLVTGAEVHGGAGVTYRIDRHFALRGDGGVSMRRKSIAFDDARHVLLRLGGSVSYRF